MMMMMMMMNCFCGMVGQPKAFSLISSRYHCQRSSPSWISDTSRAGFEPAQNLSSGLVEWSCAVVITTTPRMTYYDLLSNTLNNIDTSRNSTKLLSTTKLFIEKICKHFTYRKVCSIIKRKIPNVERQWPGVIFVYSGWIICQWHYLTFHRTYQFH